jgi:hypothetical protein
LGFFLKKKKKKKKGNEGSWQRTKCLCLLYAMK